MARSITAWLLLLAMALAGAVPRFPARLSAADLAALDVCSPGTHAAADAGAGSPDDRGQPATDGHHCALCTPAAGAALPVTVASLQLARADLPAFRLPELAQPPHPGYEGSIWRPRGPPGRA